MVFFVVINSVLKKSFMVWILHQFWFPAVPPTVKFNLQLVIVVSYSYTVVVRIVFAGTGDLLSLCCVY